MEIIRFLCHLYILPSCVAMYVTVQTFFAQTLVTMTSLSMKVRLLESPEHLMVADKGVTTRHCFKMCVCAC